MVRRIFLIFLFMHDPSFLYLQRRQSMRHIFHFRLPVKSASPFRWARAGPRSCPGSSLFIQQAGYAGQLFALQEFQAGAAAGGDVGHLVGIAQLLHGGRGVAAADDGDGVRLCTEPRPRPRCPWQRRGTRTRPWGRSRSRCPRPATASQYSFTVSGPMSRPCQPSGISAGLDHLAVGVGCKGVGAHGVHRQQQLHALSRGLLDHLIGVAHPNRPPAGSRPPCRPGRRRRCRPCRRR